MGRPSYTPPRRLVPLLVGAILAVVSTDARAQDLEPRAYANTPVGLNFLIAGYTYSRGGVASDPSVPLKDAAVQVHGGALAYARAFGVLGQSAKVDMVLPFARISGSATFAGEPRERDVSGLGDPRVRFSLNFVRHASSTDLNEAWEEGFANNAKEQVPVLKERIEMLKGWMADMQSGQRLTFTHKPGAGIQVDVNGAVKGTIKGDDFAKTFLSIWLGGNLPNPGLKAGLLGGACG